MGVQQKNIGFRVATYLRRSLNGPNQYKIKEVKLRDSKKDNLIQLADIVAGAINRSLQNDKTDSHEYIKIIKSKIVILKSLSERE